jgi:uncharacterized membrane protein YqhA
MLGALPPCAEVADGTRCTTLTEASVMWQTIIHCVFIVSALGIAWTDRVMGGNGNRAH